MRDLSLSGTCDLLDNNVCQNTDRKPRRGNSSAAWAMPGGREQQAGVCGCGSKRASRKQGHWFWTLKGAGGGTTGVGEDVAKGHRSGEGARSEYLLVEGRELRARRAGWGCGF